MHSTSPSRRSTDDLLVDLDLLTVDGLLDDFKLLIYESTAEIAVDGLTDVDRLSSLFTH